MESPVLIPCASDEEPGVHGEVTHSRVEDEGQNQTSCPPPGPPPDPFGAHSCTHSCCCPGSLDFKEVETLSGIDDKGAGHKTMKSSGRAARTQKLTRGATSVGALAPSPTSPMGPRGSLWYQIMFSLFA